VDELYHEPKYRPGDVVIFKWPLYQETEGDPAFEYRYYICLSANSTNYRLLRLKTGSGYPKYIENIPSVAVDRYEGKVLYRIDADKIRELCCEGPQI